MDWLFLESRLRKLTFHMKLIFMNEGIYSDQTVFPLGERSLHYQKYSMVHFDARIRFPLLIFMPFNRVKIFYWHVYEQWTGLLIQRNDILWPTYHSRDWPYCYRTPKLRRIHIAKFGSQIHSQWKSSREKSVAVIYRKGAKLRKKINLLSVPISQFEKVNTSWISLAGH